MFILISEQLLEGVTRGLQGYLVSLKNCTEWCAFGQRQRSSIYNVVSIDFVCSGRNRNQPYFSGQFEVPKITAEVMETSADCDRVHALHWHCFEWELLDWRPPGALSILHDLVILWFKLPLEPKEVERWCWENSPCDIFHNLVSVRSSCCCKVTLAINQPVVLAVLTSLLS